LNLHSFDAGNGLPCGVNFSGGMNRKSPSPSKSVMAFSPAFAVLFSAPKAAGLS